MRTGGGALMLIGGAEDIQLRRLAEAAHGRGLPLMPMVVLDEGPRGVTWDLDESDGLILRDETGAPVAPRAAFLRQDVFKYLRTGAHADNVDARAWKVLFDGWLASRPEIRRFNRRFYLKDAANKPHALILAREAGLAIPRTRFTTLAADARALLEEGERIYKPIDGGDHCRPLKAEELAAYGEGVLPRPYIFQERLVAPEIRVFRVGSRFVAFRVDSPSLDYRENQDAALTHIEPPAEVLEGLTQVSDALGLDFCAADFKTRARGGALCFMEINSNPMFAAFDAASGGALCGAMLDELMEPSG